MNQIKIAMVGCGAVSERCHLPALLSLNNVDVKILIDSDTQRARQLAKRFGIPSISDDYHDIIGKVDAAILALPHHLHATVAADILKQGIHVLIEKPMAITSAECRAMLSVARENNALIAVGHMRRFLYAAALAKEIIESGMLGTIEFFDVREGNVYNWPVHSDFFFRPETAGGGVLLDTGAHTLDLLLWWLGDVLLESYFDDNYGGVEADCKIHMVTASGAKGVVELSRTRNLRNTAIIQGQLGKLEIALRSNELHLSTRAGRHTLNGCGNPMKPLKIYGQTFTDLFVPQIADFIEAVHHNTPPKVSGEEAAKTVALIEKCYQQRCLMKTPGLSPEQTKGPSAIGQNNFNGKSILITGATGFIGGRLVERLVLDYGARVKVLVRNFKNASRIARFPVEMIPGDIMDKRTVLSATEGCQLIFHCAYDFGGNPKHREDVAVKGTKNLCQAVIEHNIDKIVHVSTFSVYGETLDGDLNEDTPRRPSKDIYTRTKCAAEEMVLKYSRSSGLPAVVIQPTIVYGPYSRPWTIGPIEQLRNGRVVVVNGGEGLCNAVYIDDVIDAMILAAANDQANGEVFLISGQEPVSWKEFYEAYEILIGSKRILYLNEADTDELRKNKNKQLTSLPAGILKSLFLIFKDQSLWERIYNIPGIKIKAEWFKYKFPGFYDYTITKVLGLSRATAVETSTQGTGKQDGEEIFIPDQTRLALLRSKTRVSIEKAQKILGYQPRYSFEDGMALTGEFLKWGNYLTK